MSQKKMDSIDFHFHYVYHDEMSRKKIILLTLVILGAIVLFSFFDYFNKKGLFDRFISPNILYITQPVTSFSGVVDKIEGNKLTVSQKQIPIQNIIPPAAINASTPPSPLPTPRLVIITYQVITSDKTQINQSPVYINYLFKTVTPPPPQKLAMKDIKVGQHITITSQNDLRTLTGNVFEAIMVTLPQKMNTLNGKIIRLDGNTMSLKAFAPTIMGMSAGIGGVEKEYTVSITQDTEISHMVNSTGPTAIISGESPAFPKAEKLALSDLKNDMLVTVYADSDVTTNTNVTALRIEPIIITSTPVASVAASLTP